MKRIFTFLLLACVLGGCAAKATETPGEIAIYLPAQQMSGHDILAADLSTLELEDEPLIAADEIVAYTLASHDLEVSAAALERLEAMTIPLNGIGFVVCLDKTPLFAGAIWTPLSSLSFEGVTIQILPGTDSTTLHLYSGYPYMDEIQTGDPREDERMLEALEEAGKLR